MSPAESDSRCAEDLKAKLASVEKARLGPVVAETQTILRSVGKAVQKFVRKTQSGPICRPAP